MEPEPEEGAECSSSIIDDESSSLDVILFTPGIDDPIWRVAARLRVDNEQRRSEAAAGRRYAAGAGQAADLPTRGFVGWSPSGSPTDEDYTPTEIAYDTDEYDLLVVEAKNMAEKGNVIL